MADLSPHADYLVDIARAAEAAGHGKKGSIYKTACQHLGISLAELHRRLHEVSVRKPRKQRAEAGSSALSYDEAFKISAYLNEHIRRNGKRIKSCEAAVDELRANEIITAARADKQSGELKPLSTSAILRALSVYRLHPNQVNQPDPVQELSSPHPNWCWQIDASLCVIYKMPVRGGGRIEEVKSHEMYKNKLSHLARIEHLLVQRYLITDHASGSIAQWFGLGGESAEGLVSALINTFIGVKGFPMYGVPNILMLDQASANRSAMVRNLCQSLGVRFSWTMPGNPRSKGQVEGSHNVFERGFESGLKLLPEIASIEQLQHASGLWIRHFNGTRTHSRHGMSRYEAWQTITAAQLRTVALDEKGLRQLARSEPKHPKVTPSLTVDFMGREFDVSQVPDVLVGQKLAVCRCGFDEEQAFVWLRDGDGRETFHAIPQVARTGQYGFRDDAPTIGERFKRHEDTPVQTARKAMELFATGAETLEASAEARKQNVTPFGGTIDPLKTARNYEPPAWMPKRGTEVELPKAAVVGLTLNLVDLVDAIAAYLGRDWRPEYTNQLLRWHPDGAAESEIPALAERLAAGEEPARPALKLVGGGNG